MQRQSLGSPNSKLHIHGGGLSSPPKQDPHITVTEAPDSKRSKDSHSPSSSSSLTDYDDDQHKSLKPRRLSLSQSPPSSKPENLIHLIPLLTLICFLILYLSSHNPSQSDLAQFHGFRRSSKHIDSTEMSRFVELHRGDVLAIRSLRNLQEIRKHAQKSRSNRKFADF